jgi:RNA polymerase sigma-70 factor (ECF subfamily)
MQHTPITAHERTVGQSADELASLVARARAGDTTAFAVLYRRHIAAVYAFAARQLGDRERAEDATQEVFTRALAGIGRCRNDAAFAGWLFGIAHHVVAEQYKANRHRTFSLDLMAEPVDPDFSPEERALAREQGDELRRARERCLTDSERALFDLLLAGLADAQIAVALGRRPGAIRTAHWRLLLKLRGCLSMLNRGKGVGHAAV